MLQSNRPKPIQRLILDPPTSHILQDESCAPIRLRAGASGRSLQSRGDIILENTGQAHDSVRNAR
jgi:hypothetical protein